jgi:hypothetical protein
MFPIQARETDAVFILIKGLMLLFPSFLILQNHRCSFSVINFLFAYSGCQSSSSVEPRIIAHSGCK